MVLRVDVLVLRVDVLVLGAGVLVLMVAVLLTTLLDLIKNAERFAQIDLDRSRFDLLMTDSTSNKMTNFELCVKHNKFRTERHHIVARTRFHKTYKHQLLTAAA